MPGVFRHGNVRDQRRRRHAALDQPRRRLRLNDRRLRRPGTRISDGSCAAPADRRNPSSASLTSSPIRCSWPAQHGQTRRLRLDHLLAARQMLRQRADIALGLAPCLLGRRFLGGVVIGRLRRRGARPYPPSRARVVRRNRRKPLRPRAEYQALQRRDRRPQASRSPHRGQAPILSAKPDRKGEFRCEAPCSKAIMNTRKSPAKQGVSSDFRRPLHHFLNDLRPFRKPLEKHGELRRRQPHDARLDRRPGERSLPPAICTSGRNAASTNADEQLVRVTHPFHPLFEQQLRCVGKRYNRYGERFLLQTDGGEIWSVPRRWTDLVIPDPEVAMGNGDLLLRIADWMQLAELVEDLLRRTAARTTRGVRGIMPPSVNRITPQGGRNDAE